ncbi:MFS transporter [Salmonella enterica]|uniref:MFS transporter n=1 Tax=Salmonella enterica TaxID=28901 RepID=A0A5T6MF57_SALER|nr:MFS transporter [Salmonella enterica]EBM5111468.1 MFS transporter [Salmonella enterica]EBM5848248.1 MFS transporter [Salmonella enterica]EBN8148898.1 MFS transporter [Salmonella enterica]EEI0262166.1 MFS transporter [Salmonella enterica]
METRALPQPAPGEVRINSCIGLISALLMPEVRDRDLSLPEDAAEATAAEKLRHSATQTS